MQETNLPTTPEARVNGILERLEKQPLLAARLAGFIRANNGLLPTISKELLLDGRLPSPPKATQHRPRILGKGPKTATMATDAIAIETSSPPAPQPRKKPPKTTYAVIPPPQQGRDVIRTAAPPEIKKTVAVGIEHRVSPHHKDSEYSQAYFADESGAIGLFESVRSGQWQASKDSCSLTKDAIATLNTLPSTQAVEEGIQTLFQNISENLKNNNKGETTATVVKIWKREDGEKRAVVGNCGTSRVFIFRNRNLISVTSDDNRIKKDFKDGLLSEDEYLRIQHNLDTSTDPNSLPSADRIYFSHGRTSVAKKLGGDSFSCETTVVPFYDNDQIIITNAHHNLTLQQLTMLLQTGKNPQHSAELISRNARSLMMHKENKRAFPSDVTTIVMEVT